ncbi:BnaA07g28270D [Brassica napus]|uniref:BnaA07g28270D protein n=1 Tax=Brassica napus TaxID=3708 RepID=A0A078HJR6_BRANA|nr:BnaA07g28270D [Brassica napus]
MYIKSPMGLLDKQLRLLSLGFSRCSLL